MKTVKTLLGLIRGLYMLRTCNYDLSPEKIHTQRFKVCLEYHLGNCKGPCEGLQTEEDYQKRRRARAEARRKVRAQHAQLREAAEAAVSDQKPAPVPTATRPAGSPHAAAHEPQGGRRQHPSAVALGQGMDSITLAKVSAESNGGD